MKIGFLGSGSVAQTLGRAFAAGGHEVRLSSRAPQDPRHRPWLADAGSQAAVTTFREAAEFAQVVIPAVQPWTILQPLLASVGADSLHGKVVIDLGNAVDWSVRPPQPALPGGSLGEKVQEWLPDSRVVKTLNTVAASRMARPQFKSGIPTLFLAGNDAAAKTLVASLLEEIGWSDFIDLGDIRQSRLLESLMLVTLFSEFATKARGGTFAFLRS